MSWQYNHTLSQVLVFIHVRKQCKEAVFIEHLNIISLILIKDITEINLQQAKDHAWVNFINDFTILIITKNITIAMYKKFFLVSFGEFPITFSSSYLKVEKKFSIWRKSAIMVGGISGCFFGFGLGCSLFWSNISR